MNTITRGDSKAAPLQCRLGTIAETEGDILRHDEGRGARCPLGDDRYEVRMADSLRPARRLQQRLDLLPSNGSPRHVREGCHELRERGEDEQDACKSDRQHPGGALGADERWREAED